MSQGEPLMSKVNSPARGNGAEDHGMHPQRGAQAGGAGHRDFTQPWPWGAAAGVTRLTVNCAGKEQSGRRCERLWSVCGLHGVPRVSVPPKAWCLLSDFLQGRARGCTAVPRGGKHFSLLTSLSFFATH